MPEWTAFFYIARDQAVVAVSQISIRSIAPVKVATAIFDLVINGEFELASNAIAEANIVWPDLPWNTRLDQSPDFSRIVELLLEDAPGLDFTDLSTLARSYADLTARQAEKVYWRLNNFLANVYS